MTLETQDLVFRIGFSFMCDVASKHCGGAGTHEISKTQKAFGEIPVGVKVNQIIKFFNEDPKSNLGKLKN